MNKECRKLLGIQEADAIEILQSVYELDTIYYLHYWAFPYTFGHTSGPLSRSDNIISGQAMTTFTIEVWSDGRHSVLFCQGLVIAVRRDVDGFDPVRVRL